MDGWGELPIAGAPTMRWGHTAVWTGAEMIVWGGTNGNALNDGARYDAATQTWTAVALIDAPSVRHSHTAIWTGTEMIIWGGLGGGIGTPQPINGGRFNPVTGTWTTISGTTGGAPSMRSAHTAVWTGSEMIIWGGHRSSTYFNDGARYNPVTGTWTPMSVVGAPSIRSDHTAVWTGTEMIVWGGWDRTQFLGDGAKYNPTTDTWTPLPLANAPSGREQQTAVWTGTEMIVWGGWNNGVSGGGSRYNPATNTWTALSAVGEPAARNLHAAVWTGTEMIVSGGQIDVSALPSGVISGGRYNVATDTWTALPVAAAPLNRTRHTAVWTGTVMIVWGGAPNRADAAQFWP